MRRANNPKWIFSKEGSAFEDLMGIGCGSDMCAEHECGVQRMQEELGCDEKKDGIARRTITLLPEKNLSAFAGPKYDAIFFEQTYGDPLELKFKDVLKDELKAYSYPGAAKFICAWDESSFGIVAYGKKDDPDRTRVRALWEAFQRKDIALWTHVGAFHIGMGLMFAIVSKVPDELKVTMLDDDMSHKRLAETVKKTGIEEELLKAGKVWFALSPRWSDEKETEVKWWLNPRHQDDDNIGWFGLADLQQWAKGAGPIPKTEEQRKRR